MSVFGECGALFWREASDSGALLFSILASLSLSLVLLSRFHAFQLWQLDRCFAATAGSRCKFAARAGSRCNILCAVWQLLIQPHTKGQHTIDAGVLLIQIVASPLSLQISSLSPSS